MIYLSSRIHGIENQKSVYYDALHPPDDLVNPNFEI